ncbi:MAG: hypothetical protein MUE61_20540 [Vicinamibacterales bacterium]|jgi:hypothetical protein|nr:hypothetical protein [Vicinamibacterales bacterium]
MPGRVIRGVYVATVVVFLASLVQYYQRNTGFTTLISFGDQFEKTRLPAVIEVPHFVHYQSPGYDGQFYAQLAVEPLLRNRRLERAIDSPSYRARRILFSWTAYLFGLGRPAWILKIYALQNIVAWLLLAWILLRWLPPSAPRNALAWIGCLFGVGLIYSVRFALTEGPGVLLIALAVIAIERGRPWLASGLMALVGLGRETNVIAGGLLVDRVPTTWRETIRLALRGALMVAPFAAWFLYVRSVFPPLAASDAANFAAPFSGYLSKWEFTLTQLQASGWWGSWARFNLAALVSLTVQAAFLLARREWGSAWWRAGVPYALLMPLLSYPIWEGDPGAIVRVVLPMSVAFNVLVVRSRWFWPLVIAGNLTVVHGIHMIRVPWLAAML